MSRSRAVGTAAESAVVEFMRLHGFPLAERRALHGAHDLGDVAGVPGVAVEVKAGVRAEYGMWLSEARAEAWNAGAAGGVVVHKPRGVGLSRAGDFRALMTLATFCELVREDRP